MKSFDFRAGWQWLKEHRLVYNLCCIAAALAALLVVAHVAMMFATRHSARRTVPVLTGIPIGEAEALARRSGLEVVVNDSLYVTAYEGGIVLNQLPEEGVEVKPGRKIYVTINAFSHQLVDLPYVAGRSLRQAKNMLETAGLEIDRLVYRSDMATNYVLEERYRGEIVTPRTKQRAEAGSGVTLYVGVEGGSGTTAVPNVVGLPLRDAKSRLWENGLNVGKVLFDEGINLLDRKDARVCVQQPAVGRMLTLGTEVDLQLTLDEKLLGLRRDEAEKAEAKAAAERQKLEAARRDSIARADMDAAVARPADEPAEPEPADEFFD